MSFATDMSGKSTTHCHICYKFGAKRCPCQTVGYCSTKCQKSDYKAHKKECQKALKKLNEARNAKSNNDGDCTPDAPGKSTATKKKEPKSSKGEFKLDGATRRFLREYTPACRVVPLSMPGVCDLTDDCLPDFLSITTATNPSSTGVTSEDVYQELTQTQRDALPIDQLWPVIKEQFLRGTVMRHPDSFFLDKYPIRGYVSLVSEFLSPRSLAERLDSMQMMYDATAALSLADTFRYGLDGVTPNKKSALMLYEFAARSGYPQAMTQRAIFEESIVMLRLNPAWNRDSPGIRISHEMYLQEKNSLDFMWKCLQHVWDMCLLDYISRFGVIKTRQLEHWQYGPWTKGYEQINQLFEKYNYNPEHCCPGGH